jgi:hypothetical protein
VFSVALLVLTSCTGKISSPLGPRENNLTDQQISEFVCDENAGLPPAKLRRLTRAQYSNTLRDFVAAALPKEPNAWSEIESQLDALPRDAVNKSAPFSTMDQAVSQQHVDTYLRTGEQVARTLTATPARLAALAPCSATDQRGCVDELIRRLGRRAYRRPLAQADVEFLRSVYGADKIDAAAVRDLITVLLNAPQFVYLVEYGGEPVRDKPGMYELDDFELASRLSYHFWQSAPDEPLLQAAAAGDLRSDAAYARVVDDMLADPRTERSLETFIDEWFDLEALRPLDGLKEDPVFAAFAGDDVPTPELRDDMLRDVRTSFTYHVAHGDGLNEWLESPYSFARSESLAAIYKTPVWAGSGEPPRFPKGERAGLLTRAALLATGTANTRPIMKGVFIRQRLLCDAIPPPPANAANVPPELSGRLSTREVVQSLTEAPKTNCPTCHASLINPLGFATENYDALGRLRSAQQLFDEGGKALATRPVDTKSVPRVDPGDTRSSNGADDLLGLIVESGKPEACFALQYLRFTYGRSESMQSDGCALELMRSSLERGESLQQALRELALRPEFRRRFVD